MKFFNLFSSKTSSKSYNQIATEFKTLDFKKLLEESYFYKENESEGQFNSITYEANLDVPFLNVFNKIRLRISTKEKQIEKLKMVTFVSDDEMEISEVSNLVNTFTNLFKIYDDDFTEVDIMRIESGVWRGRSYLLNLGLAMIDLDETDGVIFSIAGFQQFVEYVDNV